MKGLQVTKKVRSYKKRYKVTKKVLSYKKGTKLRKRYEHGTNTGLKFNKRLFFFEYRKYFIRQRWLPVTEGHLTPTSPEAFPHNTSLYEKLPQIYRHPME
jgi:hypothetical protein